MPTPSGHGATDWPSQNRTSSAGKRSDGCPIANDQRLFGCDRVAFEEIHGTTSPRGSFLLFQRGFMFSSKNFDHQKNRTITAKKDFLRSDYLIGKFDDSSEILFDLLIFARPFDTFPPLFV